MSGVNRPANQKIDSVPHGSGGELIHAGHVHVPENGSFSNAIEDRIGLVRAADMGTLFLDEIGDLPQASQTVLLRVLQEREVTPLGGTRPIKVDLRVMDPQSGVLAAPPTELTDHSVSRPAAQ